MQILFEYHEVSTSERLESIATEKLKHLQSKYDMVHRADVFFKMENRTDDREKICDIRLSLPGPRIFASTKATSFEGAIAETVRDLEDQLRKRKEKLSTY